MTLNIVGRKPISRIEMTYKTTKVLYPMTAPAPANIPKIELVDGSKPLHSLTGYTNQALAYYSRGKVAMEHGQHIQTLSEVDSYALDFGRYLWDPLLAFDPTKFSNPQLKISWNRALADTSVTVDSLEIWAEVFDDKPVSPVGFLSAREIWSGNFLAENSVNEILIPDDEVIRQVLVRANYAGYEPWYQVDIAKLDEAADGKVIFDYQDLEMYYRRMKSRWPMLEIPFIAEPTTTARVFYIAPTDYWATILLTPVAANNYAYLSGTSARGGKADLRSNANGQYTGIAKGYLPWHTYQFPMGDQKDPADWYDATGRKPRLRLTSNTAGVSGDGAVVIETVHKY
jgi:hypothetical protein